MSEVPDASIQLIMTSPAEFDVNPSKETKHGVVLNFQEDVYRECLRVLRKSGVFVFNVGHPFTGGKTFQPLVKAGFSKVRQLHVRAMQPIVQCFMMQRIGWLLLSEAISVRLPNSVVMGDKIESLYTFDNNHEHYYVFCRPDGEPAWYGENRGAHGHVKSDVFVSNVFLFQTQQLRYAAFDKRFVEIFLKYYTKPGDWVLDVFAGTGAFGIIALEMKRNVILYEHNKRLARKIEKRLSTLSAAG